MLETILDVRTVSKTFNAPALREISFTMQSGESLALVGANGAGKSTLIKIILGLVRAGAGSGRLFGRDFTDAEGRRRVGYLPESPGYWPELSAHDLLAFFGDLRALKKEDCDRRSDLLLSVLGLKERGRRPMAGYSKGMLQRTGIAQALLHDPDLLILDEPMSGLDPRAQEKLRTILLSLRRRGKSFLISSHSLEDIRLLCDRVLVLEKSRLVTDGPTEAVLQQLAERYRSAEPWDDDPLGSLPDDFR